MVYRKSLSVVLPPEIVEPGVPVPVWGALYGVVVVHQYLLSSQYSLYGLIIKITFIFLQYVVFFQKTIHVLNRNSMYAVWKRGEIYLYAIPFYLLVCARRYVHTLQNNINLVHHLTAISVLYPRHPHRKKGSSPKSLKASLKKN